MQNETAAAYCIKSERMPLSRCALRIIKIARRCILLKQVPSAGQFFNYRRLESLYAMACLIRKGQRPAICVCKFNNRRRCTSCCYWKRMRGRKWRINQIDTWYSDFEICLGKWNLRRFMWSKLIYHCFNLDNSHLSSPEEYLAKCGIYHIMQGRIYVSQKS